MSDLTLSALFPGGGKPRKKPSRAALPPAGAGAAPTSPCSECGRRFWSQKALFGHMRCHPDRQWRGINPPAHLRRLQLTLAVGSSSSSYSSSSSSRLRDLELEVASYLVMLSQGVPFAQNGNGTRAWPVEKDQSSSSSREHLPDLNLPPPGE